MSTDHPPHPFGCTRWLIPLLILAMGPTAAWPQTPDFNREIRPLLSDNCFYCHGPDEQHREADLRLDQEDAAKALAIKPGDASESELFLRLTSSDPDQKMPPPDSGKELTAEQIEKIQIWIEKGAPWDAHWSFQPPKRPKLPNVSDPSWAKNAIDHFILAQLDKRQWKPSPQASSATLIRRLALDLTGLPPTLEQVRRFENQPTETVYEALVDEFLASPQYGERMAMNWLDAARYADTDGFQIDETRTNWPWRDWVIEAYNANKHFDDFTLEQFAGDLLPDSTENQQLATAFHRNHMTNGEGGRDPEESRMDYVIDRVNTMGTVWLGLTLGCCQCHSHKYDPLSQREYYAFTDFFNSIDEDGRAGKGAGPHLKVESPHVQSGLQASEAWLENQRSLLKTQESQALEQFETWLNRQHDKLRQQGEHRSWQSPRLIEARTSTDSTLQIQTDGQFQVVGPNPRHDDYTLVTRPHTSFVTGMRLEVYPEPDQGRLTLAENGHLILTNLKIYRVESDGRTMTPVEISSAHADHQGAAGGRVYGPVATVLDDDPRTGWTSTGREPTEARTAVFQFAEPLTLTEGQNLLVELRHRSLQGYASMRRFRVLFTDERGPVLRSTEAGPYEKLSKISELNSLDAPLRKQLQQQFLDEQEAINRLRENVAQAQKRVNQYKQAANPVSVMVLRDRQERRTSQILIRGVWDKKGEEVQAGFPSVLTTSEPTANSTSATRLELAQWLIHPQHPLTARVAVNRYWQTLFGRGLVASSEDFGAQGDPPSHPHLLDWLAVEFRESGWDIKHIQKLMVMSQTYRQSSDWTPMLMEQDPNNQWLARASRFRLPSWMIRDVVLANGGLLSLRLGGPPVFPTQPAGAWADSTMGRFHYEESVGDDLFRRSIYAFWRRSVAPTAFFDTSKRRTCQIRTVRTNTPLHALTLLNDKSVLASAFNLAKTALTKPENDASRIVWLTQKILSRSPSAPETQVLNQQLQRLREYYDSEAVEAENLIQQYSEITAAYAALPEVPPSELVAWTLVASTLLNLDEAQTRE
jgi:hypothetical protein